MSERFKVKVRFLVVVVFIILSFLYQSVEVWLMVLLTHFNVMVRPSNSCSELIPSTNSTSTDATKPKTNENTLLGSVFYAINLYNVTLGLCIIWEGGGGGVRIVSFSENFANILNEKMILISSFTLLFNNCCQKPDRNEIKRYISRRSFYTPWKY